MVSEKGGRGAATGHERRVCKGLKTKEKKTNPKKRAHNG